MSDLMIEVEKREDIGSKVSRRLARAGQLAAVVYGGGKESVPIVVPRRKVLDLMRTGGGENTVFLLKMAGTKKERHAMIRDLQVDPITREIRHIDFVRVLMTEKVRVAVAVELEGSPLGVRNEGGIVDFVTREVEVECLPGKIPQKLTIDITELHLGQHVEAGQLELPKGVALVTDENRVLASVVGRTLAAEEEEEADELLEAEPEEPELIGRRKEEEEEGD